MKVPMFGLFLLAGMAAAGPLAAQEGAAEDVLRVSRPRLGLDPGAPSNPTGTMTLNSGYEPTRKDDWVFNFHGAMQLPLTFSVGKRDQRSFAPNQSDTVFHTPAYHPSSNPRQFAWTGAIPRRFTQVNMTYGSPEASGTLILSENTLSDAFVTFDLTEILGQVITLNVGQFRSRYGIMGEYDLGRYGTPLFLELQGVGEVAQAVFETDDMAFVVEQGFGFPTAIGGQNALPTVAMHLHAGFSYQHFLQLALHYVNAFTVIDRIGTAPPVLADAKFLGAEVRLTAKEFGHLYLGAGRHNFTSIDATTTGAGLAGVPTLGPGFRVLGAQGGTEIGNQYFGLLSGTRATGALNIAGFQYDLSIANLLFPELEGYGPDVFASLFGIYTKTESPFPNGDGITRWKAGGEATYAMLPWLSAGFRADFVQSRDNATIDPGPLPIVDDTLFQILSPRLIFKSDWNSNDQLVFQYSRVNYSEGTLANNDDTGNRSREVYQDENIFTVFAGLWW